LDHLDRIAVHLVIAEDADDGDLRPELGDAGEELRREERIVVDEIARETDEVGPLRARGFEDGAEARGAREETDVEVADDGQAHGVAASGQPRQEEPRGVADGEQGDDDALPARMNAHELARREPVEAAEKDDDEREDDDDAHRERDMLTCRRWRSSTFRWTSR